MAIIGNIPYFKTNPNWWVISLSLSRALYVPNWARDWSVLYTQNGWTTASATVATVHLDMSWPLANLCIFPTLAKWAVNICWASEVLSVCWKSISFTSVVAPTSGQVGRCVQAPPQRRLPGTQNLRLKWPEDKKQFGSNHLTTSRILQEHPDKSLYTDSNYIIPNVYHTIEGTINMYYIIL